MRSKSYNITLGCGQVYGTRRGTDMEYLNHTIQIFHVYTMWCTVNPKMSFVSQKWLRGLKMEQKVFIRVRQEVR